MKVTIEITDDTDLSPAVREAEIVLVMQQVGFREMNQLELIGASVISTLLKEGKIELKEKPSGKKTYRK